MIKNNPIDDVLIAPKEDFTFGCTSFSWHELPLKKLFVNEMEALLEKQLQLSNYGNSIQKLFVGFIAYPKNLSKYATDKIVNKYYPETQIAEFSVLLDYALLLNAEETVAFQHVQDAYLSAAKSILPTFEIKSFDVQQFLVDLERLIVKKEKEEDA